MYPSKRLIIEPLTDDRDGMTCRTLDGSGPDLEGIRFAERAHAEAFRLLDPALVDVIYRGGISPTSLWTQAYRSEIDIAVSTFWDGGFDFKVGTPPNKTFAIGTVRSPSEAITMAVAVACVLYPASDFTKWIKERANGVDYASWHLVEDHEAFHMVASDPVSGTLVGTFPFGGAHGTRQTVGRRVESIRNQHNASVAGDESDENITAQFMELAALVDCDITLHWSSAENPLDRPPISSPDASPVTLSCDDVTKMGMDPATTSGLGGYDIGETLAEGIRLAKAVREAK